MPLESSDPFRRVDSKAGRHWKEARMKKLLQRIVSEGLESALPPNIVDSIGLDLANSRSQGVGAAREKDDQAAGRGGGRGGDCRGKGGGRGNAGRGGGKGCSGSR